MLSELKKYYTPSTPLQNYPVQSQASDVCPFATDQVLRVSRASLNYTLKISINLSVKLKAIHALLDLVHLPDQLFG